MFILCVVPVQVMLLRVTDGVTVMVPVCGVFPVFVVVKEVIGPVPVEAKPILALEFIHE